MKVMPAAVVWISAAIVVGGAVAVAPTAKADCADSCYGAIAYSTSAGYAGSDVNESSQAAADSGAKAECNQQASGTSDCQVVVRGTQCLALATDPTGQNELYSTGVGATKAAADAAALAGQSGFTIEGDDCNG